MKKIIILIILVGFTFACDDRLDVINPNQPTPLALNSESGIIQFGTGVYNDMFFPDANFDFLWVSQAAHEAMGDAIYIPWGNFGWRWANQVSAITLDDGTVVLPPNEGDQAISLKNRNTRDQVGTNLFNHEWTTMYFVNNSSNLILEKLEEEITFSGDETTKKGVLEAWARWWKGYAYSRLGSMYTSGLIIDDSGITNGNFLDNSDLLDEAEKQFALAVTTLNALSVNADYTTTLEALIPSNYHNGAANVPSPAEWIRSINSMRARNILVNTKNADKTTAQWDQIRTFAEAGLQSGDFEFVIRSDGNNFLLTAFVPARMLLGWHFVSERLVQDFKPGDARFTEHIDVLSAPQVNRSGRGIQYGTRYTMVEGSIASSATGAAPAYIGPSYEENALMRAEALINTGSIDTGLGFVDEVRSFQNASLAAVSGTGLTLTEAAEELRRERRIGLLLRGLPFYDARRWGVTDPVASGGGRTGVTVLDALGNVNTNATFDYKYMDYFDVPANELDLNSNTGSVPVEEAPK